MAAHSLDAYSRHSYLQRMARASGGLIGRSSACFGSVPWMLTRR